jgi:hypothetical protein
MERTPQLEKMAVTMGVMAWWLERWGGKGGGWGG